MSNLKAITEQKISEQNAPRRITRFLRPRFSLRTLLVVVTILCVLLATWILPSIRQYRAAEQIARLGGYWSFKGETSATTYYYLGMAGRGRAKHPEQTWYKHFFYSIDNVFVSYNVFPGTPPDGRYLADLPHLKRLRIQGFTQSRNFVPTPSIDLFLQQLSSLGKLEYLQIDSFTIDDSGLQAIGKLTSLEHLASIDFHGTEAGLAHLKNLQNLKELKFSSVGLSAKGFAHLAELKKLDDLEIALKPEGLEAGLVFLQKMKQLKRLSISAHLTDKHLKNLSELTNLESLNVSHAQITDAGLAHLKNLTKLTELNLGWNKIQGPGLVHLKPLQRLNDLTLDGNVFLGRESVDSLLELKDLQNLNLKGTAISGDDAQRLWRLPKIKVVNFDLPQIQIDRF